MYDNRIDIVSLKENKVVSHIKTEQEPFGLVTSQDGTQLYVANFRSGTVSVIDIQKKSKQLLFR
ncbi:hypothetical protein GCM10020331_082670 [Ectobacillus funiculus]